MDTMNPSDCLTTRSVVFRQLLWTKDKVPMDNLTTNGGRAKDRSMSKMTRGELADELRRLLRMFQKAREQGRSVSPWLRDIETLEAAANALSHTFTGNGPGVQGADNCQICGRWFDQPETESCKNHGSKK